MECLNEVQGKLLQKIRAFPDSFGKNLSRYELDTVRSIASAYPISAQISLDRDGIPVEPTLYGYEVQCGGPRASQLEHREHAECLAAALYLQPRKNLPLKRVLGWCLPVKHEGGKKLLDLLSSAREESDHLAARIASGEDELNEIVYHLYEVSPDERKTIEGFHERYSSHPHSPANAGEEDVASNFDE